ncbi:peptidylprolyl isomerase [Paenibacillus sinopodophylli]|uniref:peptidylprolyl isomerase n=1 Tax=Paenibacillus sinopodophylli TaxID=1837342 RepID=UPI00110CD76B|nr:peptidyl-prolyl cis-trans isomerase [Paenibacillus sinopodophylli]
MSRALVDPSQNNGWKYQRVLIAVIVAILAVTVFAAVAFLPSRSTDSEAVIIEVGGLPVTHDEFQLYMAKEKGSVTNYFNVTYGAEDSKNYWTETFGEERPIDKLRKQAMDEAVKGKTLQLLAMEKGLIEDSSFQSFVRNWGKNNADRANSLDKGEAIFGLGEYDLSQYYFYSLSNIKLDLQEKLGENELKVSEEEVTDSYRTHEAEFTNQTQITFNEFSIPYNDGDREDIIETINVALRRLDSGALFGEIAKAYSKDGVRKSSVILNDQQSPLKADFMLQQAATQLKVGEHSSIIDTGTSFSVIQLIDKKEGYAVPLASVAAQLQSEVLAAKFNRYLEEKANAVVVKVKQSAYDRLKATGE